MIYDRFGKRHKTYETGTHALNGIDMHIDDGEFVFLVGPSGSGKSTIIKLLTAELKPTSGSVLVNGYQLESIKRASIPYMRRTLGVIFQDFRLIENKTVYENVAFAMRVIGAAPKEIKKRVPYVLELVGLENKGRRLPNELSGGEQQRVAIARALINNPTMIIADEPTGNLDPQRSFEIMLLLEQINALGDGHGRYARKRAWWTASPSAWSPSTRAESSATEWTGITAMKHNNFSFLVGEGTKAIFKHGFMSFAAVCITVACLVIVTSFGLITYNIGLIVDDLQKENEVLICIDESYTEAEAKSVGSRINLIDNVADARFISREEALQTFVKEYDAVMYDGVTAETMRDQYIVTLEDNSSCRRPSTR